ncbi:unnamed protein product, partial [Symbiodinium sp. KB8]
MQLQPQMPLQPQMQLQQMQSPPVWQGPIVQGPTYVSDPQSTAAVTMGGVSYSVVRSATNGPVATVHAERPARKSTSFVMQAQAQGQVAGQRFQHPRTQSFTVQRSA